MRTYISVLFYLLTLALPGCKKNSTPEPSLSQQLILNTWFVHYFNNGTDKTTDFAAYSFFFSSSGAVFAGAGSTSVNGTWQIMTTGSTQTIVLTFSGNAVIQQLNDTWKVAGTGSLIELQNDSYSPSHFLHFKKI